MGLFIQKAVKGALSKSQVATGYVVTSACFLLIACNVAVFVFLPRVIAPLAIILSNVVTVILMLVALRPINTLIQSEFKRKAHELMEKERAETELKEKVSTLERANRELESRLDTFMQTAQVPANVSLSFKVETMTYDKTGYIVKEEPLERFLEDPAYRLSEHRGLVEKLSKWMDDIAHPGQKKVLYIGKYYIKASIGLDFTKIKFALDGGVLRLFGVTFSKLNDLAFERDPDDVEHCWLLNEDSLGAVAINDSGLYRDFTEAYAAARETEAGETLAAEVESLCAHYTEVFRKGLESRFPGIEFTDHIEDSPLTWYSLKEHIRDERIYPIATNMLLMADVLSGYVAAGTPTGLLSE